MAVTETIHILLLYMTNYSLKEFGIPRLLPLPSYPKISINIYQQTHKSYIIVYPQHNYQVNQKCIFIYQMSPQQVGDQIPLVVSVDGASLPTSLRVLNSRPPSPWLAAQLFHVLGAKNVRIKVLIFSFCFKESIVFNVAYLSQAYTGFSFKENLM